MGLLLSSPERSKLIEEGEDDDVQFAIVSMQGWRRFMEDAHIANLTFTASQNCKYFGVFDGHNGSEVARYCAIRLGDAIAKYCDQGCSFDKAIVEGYMNLDRQLTTREVQQSLRTLSPVEQESNPELDNKVEILSQFLMERARKLSLKEQAQRNGSKLSGSERSPIRDGAGQLGRQRSTRSPKSSSPRGHPWVESTRCPKEALSAEECLCWDEAVETEERRDPHKGGYLGHSTGCPRHVEAVRLKRTRRHGTRARSISTADDVEQHLRPPRLQRQRSQSDEQITINQSSKIRKTGSGIKMSGSPAGYEYATLDTDISPPTSDSPNDIEKAIAGDEPKALHDLCEETVAKSSGRGGYSMAGSTAVVAFVWGRHLIVGNAGDSRAVLCRKGMAVDVTIDHKPDLPSEKQRITFAGSMVVNGRIDGKLNLSRAIGDLPFKRINGLPAEQQPVTALPDVRRVRLQEDDEFFILACDGIWEVLSSQQVVAFVRYHLHQGCSPVEVGQMLVDRCLAPTKSGHNAEGTGLDNMTVLIVVFKPAFRTQLQRCT